MLPDREGRFKATILDHGVAETGPNKLATFVCQYRLVSELVNGEWADVEDGLSICGFHYLEKRDGSINQVTVDSLKTAFGWDGRDPFWLQDADLNNLVVQIKLGFEEYEGKSRIRVQFVDAEDASPRDVPKSDDNSRRAINTRLGSKFRAMAGGSPAPAPRPTAPRPVPTKPAQPAATATPVPADAASAPECSLEEAWATFAGHCVDKAGIPWPQDRIEQEWFSILSRLFPGKQIEQLTRGDWAVMRAEGPALTVPF